MNLQPLNRREKSKAIGVALLFFALAAVLTGFERWYAAVMVSLMGVVLLVVTFWPSRDGASPPSPPRE